MIYSILHVHDPQIYIFLKDNLGNTARIEGASILAQVAYSTWLGWRPSVVIRLGSVAARRVESVMST